jgi:hypothetical protein
VSARATGSSGDWRAAGLRSRGETPVNGEGEGERNGQAPASRQYRHMARQIEREFGVGQRGVCLAFTSPDGEQATADIVLLLAFCLQSELDSRVLIVDARIPGGSGGVTGRLGLTASDGYAEILGEGFSGHEQLIRPSGASNIDIVPAGVAYRGRSGPSERLAITELIDAARARYGHVLVQVGPVQGSTRNLMAAALADATFVVALEDHTPMRSLDASRELLARFGVSDVRVVLTHGKS